MLAAWWALAEYDRPVRTGKIDWVGATALTVALVSLNLALLGSAEIQSVRSATVASVRPGLMISPAITWWLGSSPGATSTVRT